MHNIEERLLSGIGGNPFSRAPLEEITFSPRRFASQFIPMNVDAEAHFAEHGDLKHALEIMTPGFQRDADKWSREKQAKFIENSLSGFRTTLQIFGLASDTTYSNSIPLHSKVLDGLQRSTAWVDFIEKKFTVFDGLDFDDIKGMSLLNHVRCHLQCFVFNTEREACAYYIDMNRGFTHSEADIARAERYMANLPK